jgi:squalene monooxygenase
MCTRRNRVDFHVVFVPEDADMRLWLWCADCLEGIDAQRVLGYALFKEGRDAKVGYPLEGYGDDIAGRSFHNGRFIQKMREKASTLPQ